MVIFGNTDAGDAVVEIGEGRMLRSKVLLKVLSVVGVAAAAFIVASLALPVFEPAVP